MDKLNSLSPKVLSANFL